MRGAFARFLVIAAVVYLALVEGLAAAHAASEEAKAANGHKANACIYCIAADRLSHGLVAGPAPALRPAASYEAPLQAALEAAVQQILTRPQSRAPPIC